MRASLKTVAPCAGWKGENITANNQACEHWYRVTLMRTAEELSGIEAEPVVDAGSYSIWPSGPSGNRHGSAQSARPIPDPA